MLTQKKKLSKNKKPDLIYENMSSILELIHYLENCFGDRFLMYFQDYACSGFKYPFINNFLAKNVFDKKIKQLKLLNADYIEMRFFCNTNHVISTKNSKNFLLSLNKKHTSPVFFAVPYKDKIAQEKSFIIKSALEIKIKFTPLKRTITFKNYTEDKTLFIKIKEKCKNIFSNKNNIYKKTDIKKSSETNIEIDHNIDTIINNSIEHMKKGDFYLINMASTVTIHKDKKFMSHIDFMKSWEKIRSRYGFFYKDKEKAVACFSPERFIAKENNFLIAEPIKGTLRTKFPKPTIKDAENIWKNEKEIYEHTLVVDLLRNDLNYVCDAGSVEVFLPFYARIAGKLIQMQSTIIGKIEKNKKISHCLKDMLPAGSVTGTPKKKVCEFISQHEKNPRGFYTGICGVVEKNGDFDTAVLIRSLYMGERGVYVGVGSGITTLSETASEIKELAIKLNSFFPTLQGVL